MRYGGLFLRIFVWFWLATTLVNASFFAGHYFFSRDLVTLTNQEIGQLERYVANQLLRAAPDPNPIRQLARKGIHLHTPDSDIDELPRALRHFIRLTAEDNQPMRKLYNNNLAQGPLPMTLNGQPVNVYIFRPASAQARQWLSMSNNPLVFLGLAISVSGLLCFGLAWHMTRPLKQLRLTTQQLAHGELSARVPETLSRRRDEYGMLGKTFDRMASNLQEMTISQQRLLSDISHELRSPLARLQIALALSRKRQGESAELERIGLEAERLELMIGELLSLSRLQLNAEAQREEFEIGDLLDILAEDVQFEAEEQGKQVLTSGHIKAQLYGNPKLLASALENVLRNAVRYAEQTIRLSARCVSDQQLELVIEDDGPGVPEHALGELFRPFYRVDEARDRHSGGAGLGLAIAEGAVRFHSGQIRAELAKPHGLRVIITLPVMLPRQNRAEAKSRQTGQPQRSVG